MGTGDPLNTKRLQLMKTDTHNKKLDLPTQDKPFGNRRTHTSRLQPPEGLFCVGEISVLCGDIKYSRNYQKVNFPGGEVGLRDRFRGGTKF